MSGPGLQPISGHTPGIGLLSIGAWKFASIVPAVEISLIHVRRDESEFVTAGAMSVRQFWSCQKNDRKPDIKSCKKTVQAYCVAHPTRSKFGGGLDNLSKPPQPIQNRKAILAPENSWKKLVANDDGNAN
jgi:hypothetical protein